MMMMIIFMMMMMMMMTKMKEMSLNMRASLVILVILYVAVLQIPDLFKVQYAGPSHTNLVSTTS